jgi:hypothetical protein
VKAPNRVTSHDDYVTKTRVEVGVAQADGSTPLLTAQQWREDIHFVASEREAGQ